MVPIPSVKIILNSSDDNVGEFSEQPYFTHDRLRLPLDGEGVLYGPF
jgi:hypothetical protein